MNNNKKALIIANLSGFLWKFELDNVCILQELGYEVHFASNINEKGYYFEQEQLFKKRIIFHHIDIARSPYMFKMNSEALKQIIRIVNEEKITLIHCHTPVGGVLGRIAAVRSINRPIVIYTAHGFHFYKGAPLINNIVYQAVERFLAPITDAMVLINQEDYEATRTMRLRSNGKFYLIPGTGLDLGYFKPASEEEKVAARRKIGIPEDTFFILSVGELNLNKNHKTVIRSIKKMTDSHMMNDSFVYGICGDGFFKADIEKFTLDLGVSHKVRLFGYQCDIYDYYAAADMTVFPSRREGLGMVGLESLAMGIPVVAADNRGTREYMQDGKNGYICNSEDVDGYIRGINNIFNMSSDERKQMSEYCTMSVKGFSKDVTHRIMREVYYYLEQG